MTLLSKQNRSLYNYSQLPTTVAFVLLLAILLLPKAALSQTWQTSVTVCNLDGSPVSGVGGNGVYDGSMASGLLTGSGGGSGTPGYINYSPSPHDWLQTSGLYLYSWMDDDWPRVNAEGYSRLYDPNSDDPVYATGNGHANVIFSLHKSYIWQTWWDDQDSGLPPNTSSKPSPPASLNFLLQSKLFAYAETGYFRNGYNPVANSDYKNLSSSCSLSDMFGESVAATAPAAPDPLSGGYDYQKTQSTNGGSHLVRVPLQWTNGKALYVVTLTGQGQAQAIDAIGNIGLDGGAYANATLNGYAQPDNRTVTISCPEIDASYHKGPYDSVHGTDRYLNQRNPDGSISTDTAAAYDRGFYGGFPFYGGNHYTASVPNFSNPAYNWTITATDNSGRDFSVPGGSKQTIQAIINLGKTLDGFPKHNSFKVDVQDTLDNAIATNTYDVNWHLPVENWTLLTSTTTTNRIYPKLGTDPSGNTSIEPNRTINYTIPTPEVDVAGPAVKTISVFLSGAGAAAPLLLPESIATGPIGVATVTLLTVGGAASAFLVPPDPGPDTGSTNYDNYIFAVGQQDLINKGAPGIQRFNPDLVGQAQAESTRLQQLYPPPANWKDHWAEDKLFSQPLGSTMRVKAQVGRYEETDSYLGDAYNQNGYAGSTLNTLTRDKNVFYVETWTFTPGPGTP